MGLEAQTSYSMGRGLDSEGFGQRRNSRGLEAQLDAWKLRTSKKLMDKDKGWFLLEGKNSSLHFTCVHHNESLFDFD